MPPEQAPDTLPAHHLLAIRRLIRFAVVFMMLGMLLGILSTEYQKKLRYTPSHTDAPYLLLPGPDGKLPRQPVALPAGMMWEAGFDLRILHGHFILIGGVIPLCLASMLYLLPRCGARPVGPTLLQVGLMLYLVGAVAALALIFYKGLYSLQSVVQGQFDLATIHANMFGGSRVVRALAHALSHTVLAAGLGVLGFALWGAAGELPTGGKPPA